MLAGEAEVGDRPVGLPVELVIGRALNVMLEITTDWDYGETRRNEDRVVVTTEHRIVNNKAVPIELEIRHGVEDYYTDVDVEESSRPMRRKYGDLAWRFTVPPGEEQLRYELSALEPRVSARASVARAAAEAQPEELDVAVPPLLAARECVGVQRRLRRVVERQCRHDESVPARGFFLARAPLAAEIGQAPTLTDHDDLLGLVVALLGQRREPCRIRRPPSEPGKGTVRGGDAAGEGVEPARGPARGR